MNLEPIFISSTFADFHAERNILRNSFFNELNDQLRYEPIHFQRIDLRWGIKNEESEEATEKKIIHRCLQEIDRSYNFMILFLGNRYGTLVDQALFNGLGICLDKPIERLSVTAIEYLYALTHLKSNQHIFFCNRTIVNTEDIPEDIRKDFISVTDEDIHALETCKSYLRSQPNVTTINYEVRWNTETNSLEPITDFTVLLMQAILSKVDVIAIDKKKSTPYEYLVQTFLKTSPFYIEREDEKNILKLLNENHVTVFGSKGTGVTTILSKIMERLQYEGRYVLVATNLPNVNEQQILTGWVRQIESWCQKPIPNSLENDFSTDEVLSYLTSLSKPIYIIVDNINSFKKIKELVNKLIAKKPEKVTCLVSNIENTSNSLIYTIQKLTYKQLLHFLTHRFEFEGKELSKEIADQIQTLSMDVYKKQLNQFADGVSDKLINEGLTFSIFPDDYENHLIATITEWVEKFKKVYCPSKILEHNELQNLIQKLEAEIKSHNQYRYSESMMIDYVIFPIVAEAFEVDIIKFISDFANEFNNPLVQKFFQSQIKKLEVEKNHFQLPIAWIEIMYQYLDSVQHFTQIVDLINKLVISQEQLISQIIEVRYPLKMKEVFLIFSAMKATWRVLKGTSLEQLFMKRYIFMNQLDHSLYDELKILLNNLNHPKDYSKVLNHMQVDWNRNEAEIICFEELLLFIDEHLESIKPTIQDRFAFSQRLIGGFSQIQTSDTFANILKVIDTLYNVHSTEEYTNVFIDAFWLFNEFNQPGREKWDLKIEGLHESWLRVRLNSYLPNHDPETIFKTVSVAQLLRNIQLSEFEKITLTEEQHAIRQIIKQIKGIGK